MNKIYTQQSITNAIHYFGSGHFSVWTLQSPRYSATREVATPRKPTDRIIRSYTGKEFLLHAPCTTQFDLMVNCGVFRLMKQKNATEHMTFTLSELIIAMHRVDGSNVRQRVRLSLLKHAQTHMDIDFDNHHHFSGCKIISLTEITPNHFQIIWNSCYLDLCYTNKTASLDFNILLKLSPGLQSWLYGFLCSAPHLRSINIDTVHDLSGANYQNIQDFKKAVKSALHVLYQFGIIKWQYGIQRDGTIFWTPKRELS